MSKHEQWIASTRECPTCKGHGRIVQASLSDPCPLPDVPGWTMSQCFTAKRCGCAKGVQLGYQPTTMPIEPAPPRVSEWAEKDGVLTRVVGQ